MKNLILCLLAVPLLSAVAGERYLLVPENNFGEVEFEDIYFKKPSAQYRVVDEKGSSVPQLRLTDYAGCKRIRFEAPVKYGKLYLEPGKPGKKLSKSAGNLLDFNKLTWKSSIPQLVRTSYGFAYVKPSHVGRPYIESNIVDIPERKSDAVIFEFEGKSRAFQPWTFKIQLLQFDCNGKELPSSAVDERWLNFYTSPGKLHHIRQAGRLDRRAAKLAVRLHLFQTFAKVDSMGFTAPKDAILYPDIEIKTFTLRSGSKCAPGGPNAKLFSKAGLLLDGKSGTAFNPAGKTFWSEGEYITDPAEYAFPLGTGSAEFDFTPNKNNGVYTVFDTHSNGDRQRKRAMELSYDTRAKKLIILFPGVKQVNIPADIPAGKRCRLALEWNNKEAFCYLNGKLLKKFALTGYTPYVLSNKNVKTIPENVGVGMSAQVLYIDASKPDKIGNFMNGILHKARFSNILRQGGAGELVCDKNTTAFFDYAKGIDAVAATGEGFVSGVWYGRTPLDTPIPAVVSQPQLPFPAHDNHPAPPTAKELAMARRPMKKELTMTPGKAVRIDCNETPAMDYIEISCPDGVSEISHPLVRLKDEIDPRSFGTIRRDLKLEGKSDAEKASAIYSYLLKVTDYFIQHPVCYPSPYRADMSDYDPLAMINFYIGEDCGPENFATLTLFNSVAGFPAALTAGNGHAFEQVFLQGSWQVWDLSAEQFMRSRDPRRGASLEELERDPYLFRLSDYFAHPGGFIRTSRRHHGFFPVPSRNAVTYRLRQGEKFRINWHNDLICNNNHCAPHMANFPFMIDHTKTLNVKPFPVKEVKWRVPPEYSTGVFSCDATPAECPALFKRGEDHFIYSFNSSYPMTAVSVNSVPASEVEYSFDGGKLYVKDPAVFVKGRRQIMIKVKCPPEKVKSFSSRIHVQMNTRALTGVLKKGKNDIYLDMREGKSAKVTVAWSEPDKPIHVDGTLSSAVAPGWEKHLLVLDKDGKFTGAVSGVSSSAKLTSSKGISAEIRDGKLLIIAADKLDNSIESVKITDNGREKSYAVLVSRKSRVFTAKNAKVRNGAKIVDGLIKFTAPEQRAIFRQERMPRGKYSTFVLFNMHFPKEVGDMRMIALSGLTEDYEVIGRIRNLGADFFIIKFSKPHFKWDFPQHNRYPYSRVKVYETRPGKKLTLKSCPQVKSENGVVCEVAALLLVDASNDDFVLQLAKYLTNYNGFPEKFK